ncbi:PREDICTED: NADH-ubiquinone oxidoreductase chain 5-like [Eufriesea mexicana]|uniref:NADH-ubiquinone oxidoreductase chain 5-like n=1 Tax=Eufriesea mexicana TaxID=516756 RepID=UPI00083C1C87|nr:PREDICTED: NADH-ubiquinone oxidoreductase chain 5-like [Eufriesea mexicana]
MSTFTGHENGLENYPEIGVQHNNIWNTDFEKVCFDAGYVFAIFYIKMKVLLADSEQEIDETDYTQDTDIPRNIDFRKGKTRIPIAIMASTPVSSLVHSSRLVTAGVYLIIRHEELLELNFKNIILFISRLTILYSGISANFELDIKKIIAYSTLRQLRFIIRILSINLKNLAFLHLFIHAIFKSLIFICVGRYIHYLNKNQNIKFYNGIFYIYPVKRIIFISSLLRLIGFPFLVGFYSKDLILNLMLLMRIALAISDLYF